LFEKFRDCDGGDGWVGFGRFVRGEEIPEVCEERFFDFETSLEYDFSKFAGDLNLCLAYHAIFLN
jgi:hypothetical protein